MTSPLESVCDLTVVMRTRLLLGHYNERIVPPRWRRVAQLYCFTLAISNVIFNTYMLIILKDPLFLLYYTSVCVQILFANVFSFLTKDEDIYIHFTRNMLTDVTLDSLIIFKRLQKQMDQFCYASVVYLAGFVVLSSWSNYVDVFRLITIIIPLSLYEIFAAVAFSRKLLVMALFNARVLILKRRLQRYGFRTFGRSQLQPYCQTFNKIRELIDNKDNSFKAMLFLDGVISCGRLIGMVLMCLYKWWWGRHTSAWLVGYLTAWAFQWLVFSFGHVAMLESAAAHCEDMALFTATQLIKNPTTAERRRMYEFLHALERRGAQYRVLRALPLDARLVLRALAFCTAQVFVFVNVIIGT